MYLRECFTGNTFALSVHTDHCAWLWYKKKIYTKEGKFFIVYIFDFIIVCWLFLAVILSLPILRLGRLLKRWPCKITVDVGSLLYRVRLFHWPIAGEFLLGA